MGIVHTHRGRLAPALILAVLMALAVVVTLGLVAGPASASSDSFTLCSSCHNYSFGDAFHAKSAHSGAGCGACHVAGSGAAGLRPSGCTDVGCHNTAGILAKTQSDGTTPAHPASTCGAAGCHAAPSPTPTPTATAVATTMTLKASPTIVRLNRSVKTTGTAGPIAALAGARVALKVERKVGTKWVKMKAVAKTVSAAGAFSWTYKAVKKGPHRVTASIAKTSTHTAKKLVRSFRVR